MPVEFFAQAKILEAEKGTGRTFFSPFPDIRAGTIIAKSFPLLFLFLYRLRL